ncbi:carotenoid oxygenase [Obelidium mucronatum]|nr:carotenoid oxygenase [Obelidium mucronatum]
MFKLPPLPNDDAKWPFVACMNDGVEVPEPVECLVSGTMPGWLVGKLYRTGPGIFNIHTDEKRITLDHWFDGIGITHRFEIHATGKVTYRNRITSKKRMESIKQRGSLPRTFGPSTMDPCQWIFQKVFSYFTDERADTELNVSVTPGFMIPGRKNAAVLALKTDSNALQFVDLDTLENVDEQQTTYGVLNPELAKGPISVAHEEFDPVTNTFMNLVVVPGPNPEYIVFQSQQAASGTTVSPEAEIIARFHDPNVAYLHSFSSTKKHIIVQLWPLSYGFKGLKISMSSCLVDAMEWNPSRNARFVVIDRVEKRVVAEYEYPPCFCFHTVNAFDDSDDDEKGDGGIVMDIVAYRTGNVVKAFLVRDLVNSEPGSEAVSDLRNAMAPSFKRIKLSNLDRVKKEFLSRADSTAPAMVMAETLFDIPLLMELPRINPKWRHVPTYRFVYGVGNLFRHLHSHALFDCLVKFDTRSQTHVTWMKIGHTPSEPIFVPNPDGGGEGGEDDGVVVSVVLDGSLAKSYLLILDAKTFTELATADTGRALPLGLHGAFV